MRTERLESRLALSVNLSSVAEQDAFFSRVSADWFASVAAVAPRAVPAGLTAMTASGDLMATAPASAATVPATSEWIVRMSPDAVARLSGVADVAAALRSGRLGLEVVRGLGLPGQVLVQATGTAADVREYLGSRSDVVSFGPNATVSLSATPNDPLYSRLYGLHNAGQTGGLADADIDAAEAWIISTGSRSVVVGVVDSGIDWSHPDLAANMWRNPGEIAGDGIDNDANGFTDDVYGYDFVNDDGDPMDDHSHGTHCAGTIGAVGDNGLGVVGVAWEVSLMGLKFLGSDGVGTAANAIRALNYATMMRTRGVNVQVTSNSWGGGEFDAGLRDAINAGGEAGILFVTSAGNDGVDTDMMPQYPAAYDSPFIVSVAATDHVDGLAGFSNYGATSVDLGAPGVGIHSTTPHSSYASFSGTSMAAPHVAGAAALALALDSTLTPADLKAKLLATADPIAALAGKTVSGGRLNVNSLVRSLGLSAVSTSPARGSSVSTVPAEYVVTFNHPFVPESLDAADFHVNGQPATGFTQLSDRSVRFTFATNPVVAEGLQTMTIPAGALTRASDLAPSLAFTESFFYDTLPLQVISTSPAAGGVLVAPGVIDVLFNEPLDPSSVQPSDLVLSGIPDFLGFRGDNVVAASMLPGNTGIRFTVGPLLVEGTWTATIAAGAVTDVHGNPLSPSPAFGSPSLAFLADFTVDFGSDSPFPDPVRQRPEGAGVSEWVSGGVIGMPGDADGFTIALDADQLVSVVVAPAAGLQPVVEVFAPDGTSLGTAIAPEADMPVVIQTARVGDAGTYRVVVTGVGGSTGDYTVSVRLNGAWETESLGGVANDTLATAQSLDAAFRTEATSFSTGSLATVTGQADGLYQATRVAFGFEDIAATGTAITALSGSDDASVALPIGFAFPLYGDSHTSVFVSSNGLLTFGNANSASGNSDLSTSPLEAAIAPFWTDLVVPDSGAVLHAISGSGADKRLTIQWQDVLVSGASGPDTLTFQVQLFADGRIRFNYLDLTGGSFFADEGTFATVGLKAAGMQGERRTLVAYIDRYSPFVGTKQSTLLTVAPNPQDVYSFSVSAGDTVSVAVRGADVGVHLLDASGTVIAGGVPVAGTVDRAIDGFRVAAAGTYYARVAGSGQPYSLTVARGARFDLGTNPTPEAASRIVGTGAVFGSVSPADTSLTGDAVFWDKGGPAAVGLQAAGMQGEHRAVVAFNDGQNRFVGALQSTQLERTTGDWYAFTAAADGGPLVLETRTPDGRLDPRIEVYDATGTVLIASGSPLADGRNESLTVSGLVAGGSYLARVSGEGDTTGDYFLGFANASAASAAPVLSGVPALARYVEQAIPTVTAPAGVVTDPDVRLLAGGTLTVAIVANGEAADRLAIRNQGTASWQVGVVGTTVTYGGAAVATVSGGTTGGDPLIVTFTSAVRPAVAQAILRNVTYVNVSDAPGTLPRTLLYRVTDGAGGASAPVQQTVTVRAVNDAAELGAIDGLATYAENATLVTAPSATVVDVDSPDFATGRLTVRVAVNASAADRLAILHQGTGLGEVGVVGTTVTFDGVPVGTVSGGTNGWSPLVVTFDTAATPAVVQAVARRVAFSIASDAPSDLPRTLVYSLADGDGGPLATVTQVVAVVPENDAPVLSGVPALASYVEQAIPTVTAPAGVVRDLDVKILAGGTLTVAIVANGEAADRLAIRNQGTASWQVGVEGTTVTYGGAAVATVSGGTTGDDPLVVTFTSAVRPAVAQAILRNVTYANVSDTPGTLPRTLEYQVADGAGGKSATVQQSVAVRAVNDAAVLNGIVTTGLAYAGPGSLLLASAASVADADSATFGGGSLQVAFLAGGLASDRLRIRSQGTAPGQVSVSGGVVSFGGIVIGTVTGGTGLAALSVALNDSATVEAVQAVLRSVTYESVALDPTNGGRNATRTIRYALTDAPAASGGRFTFIQQSLAFA